MNVGYNLKRGLRKFVAPTSSRFLPSMQYCLECKKLVPKDHEDKVHGVATPPEQSKPGFQYLEVIKKHFGPHHVVSFGRRFPNKRTRAIRFRAIGEILNYDQEIPDAYDLRDVNGKDMTAPIVDQGSEGSCTGQGAYAMKGTQERLAGTWQEDLSRRMVYEDAKYRGHISEGAYMEDIMAALKEDGDCRDHYEPYTANDPERMGVWPPTNPDSLVDAKNWRAINAYDLAVEKDPVTAIQLCILQYGAPDLGTPWTQSWMDGWVGGHLGIPPDKDALLGGHSWVIIGWYTKNGVVYFIAQNSWGKTNALRGYFDFPAAALFCKNWQDAGGWQGFLTIDVESVLCPDGQHYDTEKELCVEDGEGPNPPNCDQDYQNDVMACSPKLQNDPWGWFECVIMAVVKWYNCTFQKGFTVVKKMSTVKVRGVKKKRATFTITEK